MISLSSEGPFQRVSGFHRMQPIENQCRSPPRWNSNQTQLVLKKTSVTNPAMFLRAPQRLVLGLSILLSGQIHGTEIKKAGEIDRTPITWPRYVLKADAMWMVNPPDTERFDASALLRRSTGDLLIVNDRGARVYRINFPEGN